jgi:chromosome segregation ATPase
MAHNKNESVFLWMLEQDRQKNRVAKGEELGHNSPVPSLSIPSSSYGIREEIRENKGLQSIVCEKSDLKRLLEEKESLEEEARCLDEDVKRLSLRERTLLEQLVQETRKRNEEKKRAVLQLQEQLGGLEDRLGLGELVQKTEKSNSEKQQEIVHLRAQIGGLENELKGLFGSEAARESEAKRIDGSEDEMHATPIEVVA